MSKTVDNEDAIPRSDSTVLSLIGQNAAENDFPVLKAFQQYIDAEQAKARDLLRVERAYARCGDQRFFAALSGGQECGSDV